MPVFLAPVAAMGYMYWKKRKEERERNKEEGGDDDLEQEGVIVNPTDCDADGGDNNVSKQLQQEDNTTVASDDNNSAVTEDDESRDPDDNNSQLPPSTLSQSSPNDDESAFDAIQKPKVAASVNGPGLPGSANPKNNIERKMGPFGAAMNAAMKDFLEELQEPYARKPRKPVVANTVVVDDDEQKYVFVKGQKIAVPKISYK